MLSNNNNQLQEELKVYGYTVMFFFVIFTKGKGMKLFQKEYTVKGKNLLLGKQILNLLLGEQILYFKN